MNFTWYFEIRPCQRCKGHPPCSVPPRAWWWLTSHNLSSSWPWRCETNTQSEGQRKKKTGRATRWWFAVACCLRNLLIFLKSTWQTFLSTLNQFTYMTISFLMGLLETKAVASFSSVIGSVAFTMFWNMVLFLCGEKQVTSTGLLFYSFCDHIFD